ncbi:hypothetical protein [Pseudomonas zeae]|uniref:Uncharacterized protein n=1 Tax=Pseudomonas zeae TaxID=2745510 RepID=A0A9E6TCF9_9PSED|nr:hypothetical protein [Pseudomonas zeae]QXI13041.1 hypothetical protein HU754_006400 [Pseudomonas zeae]
MYDLYNTLIIAERSGLTANIVFVGEEVHKQYKVRYYDNRTQTVELAAYQHDSSPALYVEVQLDSILIVDLGVIDNADVFYNRSLDEEFKKNDR